MKYHGISKHGIKGSLAEGGLILIGRQLLRAIFGLESDGRACEVNERDGDEELDLFVELDCTWCVKKVVYVPISCGQI